MLMAIAMADTIFLVAHNDFGRHDDGKGHILPIIISDMAYNSLTGDLILANNVEGAFYTYVVDAKRGDKLLNLLFKGVGNITAMAFGM